MFPSKFSTQMRSWGTVWVLCLLLAGGYASESRAITAELVFNQAYRLKLEDPRTAYQLALPYREALSQGNALVYVEYLQLLAELQNSLELPHDAFVTASEALSKLPEQATGRLRGNLLYLLGVALHKGGLQQQALDTAELLAAMAQEQEEDGLLAKSHWLQGAVKLSMGKVGDAFSHLNQSLEQGIKDNDQLMIADSYVEFGRLFFFVGDYEQSRRHFEGAMIRYRQQNVIKDVGNSLFLLGGLLLKNGDLDDAEDAFQQALAIAESQWMDNGRAYTLLGLGQVALARQQFEVARQYFYQSEIVGEMPPQYLAELLKHRIRAYLGLKRYDQIPRMIERIREIYQSLSTPDATVQATELLELSAQWQAALGNHAQALQLMQVYHKKYTSLLRQQLRDQQQALYQEVVSENQRLQRTMLVREADRARQRANVAIEKASVFERQFRDQQVWLYATVASVILLTLGLGWLWISRRRMFRLASLDPLTQLSNRGYALAQGRKLFYRSELRQRPLVALRFALDHFSLPQVARADEMEADLLRQVSEHARRTLRRGELLAYMGENDFLILLSNLHVSKGYSVAQRLRGAISSQPLYAAGVEMNVSVSVGIAERERDGAENLEQLLAQAREALALAQQQGSDSVCYYQGSD